MKTKDPSPLKSQFDVLFPSFQNLKNDLRCPANCTRLSHLVSICKYAVNRISWRIARNRVNVSQSMHPFSSANFKASFPFFSLINVNV